MQQVFFLDVLESVRATLALTMELVTRSMMAIGVIAAGLHLRDLSALMVSFIRF